MKYLITILSIMTSFNLSAQNDWLDSNLYPFTAHFFDHPSGKVHYIDEGQGEVLLFIHGTPSWSFLYRNHIKELSKNYRCIAVDHLGFGLSEKNLDFPGTPQAHSEVLERFIEELNLQDITLVVHDFGGPIGLSAALKKTEKIKRVILFNTWLWETASNPEAQKIDKIVNSRLGEFLYLQLNFSPKVLLKKAFYEKKKLSKNVHNQYIKVFSKKEYRYALLKLGQSLVGSSNWYQDQWDNLHRIESKPILILWGVKDPFIDQSYLNKWTNRLPNATVVEYQCGHFVQEEKPMDSIENIKAFLAQNP